MRAENSYQHLDNFWRNFVLPLAFLGFTFLKILFTCSTLASSIQNFLFTGKVSCIAFTLR